METKEWKFNIRQKVDSMSN